MINKFDISQNENKYLRDIIKAIELVPVTYVVNSNTPGRLAERIFAYEFYHQYRSLMDKCKLYDEKYLCGEQSKLYDDMNLEETTATNKVHQCPDIVLAGNVENLDPKTQYWVAEIKMAYNQSWEKDIEKLVKYAKSQLSFQHLFFIYVCDGEEQKKEIIKKLKEREFARDEQSVFILICTKDETQKRLNVESFLPSSSGMKYSS